MSISEKAGRVWNAALEIERAILDQGINPPHHIVTMRKHRDEWPVLWEAIDKLMEELRNDM